MRYTLPIGLVASVVLFIAYDYSRHRHDAFIEPIKVEPWKSSPPKPRINPTSPMPYHAGDVIRLNSGGPLMTVIECTADDAGNWWVYACWSNEEVTHGIREAKFASALVSREPKADRAN